MFTSLSTCIVIWTNIKNFVKLIDEDFFHFSTEDARVSQKKVRDWFFFFQIKVHVDFFCIVPNCCDDWAF